MSDAAPATPATKATKKKASKPKNPSTHPKYSDMIKAAITSLKEPRGSSLQVIINNIRKNYKVNDKGIVCIPTKIALKREVASGALKQVKGSGTSGSFKVGEKAAAKKATPKAKKAKVTAKTQKTKKA